MPTDKPRVTFTMTDDMFERIEEYRFGNRFKNQTQTILDLISRGLAVYHADSGTENEFAEPEEVISPDVDSAAFKASEILIKEKVSAAPIFPLHILSTMPNVLVISFTEFANQQGFDGNNLVLMFGSDSQDAITFVKEINGKKSYIVAYNQRMPMSMLQMAFARELGHIALAHDNPYTDTTQMAEALIFARYLLCPRPLIHLMEEKGIKLTVELLGNLTGCYGRSLASIRQTPGADVPSAMNAKIKKQFSNYVDTVVNRLSVFPKDDDSPTADFGTYMDNYQE